MISKGCLTFLYLLFSNLSFASTIPEYPKPSATKSAILPPASTPLLSFYNYTCQLGLYQNGMRNSKGARWEGYPLGDPTGNPMGYLLGYPDHGFQIDPLLNNHCVNLKDLNPNLPGQLSSFQLTGWCECEFFENEDCLPESTRFSAYNRGDGSLWEHGPDDNRIRSYKCWYTKHRKLFKDCMVRVTASNDLHTGPDKRRKMPDYHALRMDAGKLEKCNAVHTRDGFDAEELVISGCSCNLYETDNCEISIEMRGDSGDTRIDLQAGKYRDRPFKSYMCFYPFGMETSPRGTLSYDLSEVKGGFKIPS
ncbi:hypothetical protein ABW20_dc0109341 [Dactylellina cionopaga]|nr:hypothetical protein ABW20_dc0109341 [Dactylellina cionopaga]